MIRALVPVLLLGGCFWKEGSQDVSAWVWVEHAGEIRPGEVLGRGVRATVCATSDRRRNSNVPVPAPGAQGETLGGSVPVKQASVTVSAGSVQPPSAAGDTSACKDVVFDQAGTIDVTVEGTVDGARSTDTVSIVVVDATTRLSWATEGPVVAGERLSYRAEVEGPGGEPIVAVSLQEFPNGQRLVGGSATGTVEAVGSSVSLGSLPPRPVQARADSLTLGPPQPTDGGFDVPVLAMVGERPTDLLGSHKVGVDTPRVCSTLREPREGDSELGVEHSGALFVRKVENSEAGPCRLEIQSEILGQAYVWQAEVELP